MTRGPKEWKERRGRGKERVRMAYEPTPTRSVVVILYTENWTKKSLKNFFFLKKNL